MKGSMIARLAVAPAGALLAAAAWAAFAAGGAPLADAPALSLNPQLVVAATNCDTNYVMVNGQSETCADLTVPTPPSTASNVKTVVFTVNNSGDAPGTVTIAPPATPTMSCAPIPLTVAAGGSATITCTTTGGNNVSGTYGFTATSNGTPSGVIVLPNITV